MIFLNLLKQAVFSKYVFSQMKTKFSHKDLNFKNIFNLLFFSLFLYNSHLIFPQKIKLVLYAYSLNRYWYLITSYSLGTDNVVIN